jgi:isochorismate hydrolase
MPIVLSTVGVEMGVNHPTRQSILDEVPGVQVIDRSSMNAWDDKPFVDAVKKTGRKRLIFGALYTEICLAFPVVSAMKDGYDAAFVVDAVGGLSQLAHRTAIERLTAAGAVSNTALALVTELFRDWKSPVAGKAREILKQHLNDVKQFAAN